MMHKKLASTLEKEVLHMIDGEKGDEDGGEKEVAQQVHMQRYG